MDIECSQYTDNKTALFRPIEHFNTEHLYHQNIVLENTFS